MKIKIHNILVVLFIIVTYTIAFGNGTDTKRRPFANEEDSFFRRELNDYFIKYNLAEVGMKIPLHSVIITPAFEQDGANDAFITIKYPRDLLDETFIRDMFYGGNNKAINIHPLKQRGIEIVLTKNNFFLTIHQGVILHLRNDIEHYPKYKTFKSDSVIGEIIEVQGKIIISIENNIIKERLSNVYIQYYGPISTSVPGTRIIQLPDGSYKITMPVDWDIDLPKNYEPKVMEDR